MKTALLLTLILSATTLPAEDVTLEWVGGGFSTKQGYYKPQRVELTAEKPANITKIPEGVTSPLYATLSFGTADAETKVAALLDEPSPDKSRFWLDANGNGDLTDDPAPTWTPRTSQSGDKQLTMWSGGAMMPVKFGAQERLLGLQFYRFDKSDQRRAGFKTTLFYYRDFGLAGKVTIGEKTYEALISDDKARGDFMGSGDARLSLDLNGDGKFDSRSEGFATSEPFNIGGTTYELAGLKAGGTTFQIVKSQQTVAEKVVPAAIKVGVKAAPFEDKTTDGNAIRFPGDYKGKLVMLDFWATWCGPCIGELPNLTKVYAEFHAKGFEILGVSLDNEATLPKLKQFTQDKGMTWPQIADGKGWEAKLGALYGVRSIPSCFLVDGTTGLLVATTGELRGESLRGTVERALDNLGKPPLAGGSGTPNTTSAPPPEPESPLVKKAQSLVQAGDNMSAEKFLTAVKNPDGSPVTLPEKGTQPLRGRAIAERAAAAHLRVGWLFQCTKCSKWHTNLAGGYAIAKDAVVTAHHVFEAPENMKPGTGIPVIVRGEDDILAIRSVIATDAASDTMILRVAGESLSPLSLMGDVRAGDNVFCLSDPRGLRDYFSTGIVNRHYTRVQGKADDPRDQRLHVSTDWAQGSSGSAVLDECGNVVGHVSRISPVFGQKTATSSSAPSLMTLHEAIPATCVLQLLQKKTADAATK